RVELVGLAVGVAEGTRVERAQQWRAALGRGREQLVDEAVLRAPQAQRIEARALDELGRGVAAAMRRGEHQRQGLPGWPKHLEDGVADGDLGHGSRRSMD